jgi:hypothetical protein
MSSRNTEVLQQIIQTLDGLLTSRPHALARLEIFFKDSLLIVAGNETDVAQHAEHLRLAIIENERGPLLDYIEEHRLAHITIDHVEEAINTLFPGRFVEP